MSEDENLFNVIDQQFKAVGFRLFRALYYAYVVTVRPDIRALYVKYCAENLMPLCEFPFHKSQRRRSSTFRRFIVKRGGLGVAEKNLFPAGDGTTKSPKMSVRAFCNFLSTGQLQHGMDELTAKLLVNEYDSTFHQDGSGGKDPASISVRGFAHYLLSQEPLPGSRQDLSLPLSNYFIATSHNTYLTGHQLHGESSAAMYAKVSPTDDSHSSQCNAFVCVHSYQK